MPPKCRRSINPASAASGLCSVTFSNATAERCRSPGSTTHHASPPTPIDKHLFYLHPALKSRLLRLGCSEEELTYVSYGLEVAQTEAVPEQKKLYDVVWIGRVHRQKGIDDLL